MIDLAGQFQFSGLIIHILVGLSDFSVCGFRSSLSIFLLCFQRSKVYFDVIYIIIPKGAIYIGLKLQFEWFSTFFQIVTKKGYFRDGISENRLEEAQD